MPKSKKIEEFVEKITATKEVLSAMPKNNEKNRKKYIEKLDEIQKEYEAYKNDIEEQLKKRYKNEVEQEPNKEIENLETRLTTIESTLDLLSEEKTSYEKMGLDRTIYQLTKYYKENLERVNEQIRVALEKFSKIGIKITAEDFDYSQYARNYMGTFFKELEKGNINSDKIKAKFEEIYWKCPEIMVHIELNFRNIYLKKQAIIDKYFEKEKNNLLKKWDKTPKEIFNSYMDLKKIKIEKEAIDKNILLNKFLNKELDAKEFEEEKVKLNCQKVLPKGIAQKIFEDEETQNNIQKFLSSLYEYKNYMDFKFIIDDVKKYYQDKEQYKKAYQETKKKIDLAEKKLKKYNKKAESKGLFGKKKDNTNKLTEQKQLIVEIKEYYKELDLNKFYNKICSSMTDNSSLYDVLILADSYYNYLISCLIKNNKNITQEEMDEKIKSLDEFLKSPYHTMIEHINITEEKDVALIIKDRYKLLNFTVEKEDLDINNIDGLIETLENIQIGINMKKAGLDAKNIEQLCKIKELKL